MNIHIATDHAGLELKQAIVAHLSQRDLVVTDHGAHEFDPNDDYPPLIIPAAQAVASDWSSGSTRSLGIVIGGSGNGEQIAANKVKGIRAALAWSLDTAKLARQHNDANIVAIGARQHSREEALAIVDSFINEPFSGEDRHQRRIDQLSEYEKLP